MITAAIYARVSTTDQSAESQLMELRSYAQRRGFTVHREYVDHVTGVVSKRKKGKGAQFDALLSDAIQKRFDVVLVWKFDRFARSLKVLIECLQLFQSLKIDFISVTQAIDTTTPMGVFFFQVVGAFAELEREMIVERVKAGISNARANGVKLGRRKLGTIGDEQQIYDMHSNGLSLGDIAYITGRSRSGVRLVIKRHLVLASTESSPSPEVDCVRPGRVL
jgi:DNA invertase Pin-like site-specific DNA recombinase